MFIVKSIKEAKRLLNQKCENYSLETIRIDVDQALNYISAETITSSIEIPHFQRSTVDGYAVIHSVVSLASAQSPINLELLGSVEMGKACKYILDEQSTVYVPTGGQIPHNATAVVMIENTDTLGNDILISKRVSKWENVLLKGSDIQENTVVIHKNQRLTPTRLGALKAVGVEQITVYKKLKTLVISTGDEITDQLPLGIGEVLDINTHTIKHYLQNKHVDVVKTHVIKDNFEEFKSAILKGFEDHDLIVASGGSSVGDRDYTYKVMETIGADIFVHGMNIKPGKPTVLATYKNKLFIGLPGQPSSAYMVLQTLFPTIYKAIYALDDLLLEPYVEGVLTQNVASAQGRTTYQLVMIEEAYPLNVVPLHSKSGMIRALKDAYGYIILEAGAEGYSKGEIVKVYRLGD